MLLGFYDTETMIWLGLVNSLTGRGLVLDKLDPVNAH